MSKTLICPVVSFAWAGPFFFFFLEDSLSKTCRFDLLFDRLFSIYFRPIIADYPLSVIAEGDVHAPYELADYIIKSRDDDREQRRYNNFHDG